jgi:hypothetical protein
LRPIPSRFAASRRWAAPRRHDQTP